MKILVFVVFAIFVVLSYGESSEASIEKPGKKTFTIDDVYKLLLNMKESEELQVAAIQNHWKDTSAALQKTMKSEQDDLEKQHSQCELIKGDVDDLTGKIKADNDKITANNNRRKEIQKSLVDLRRKRCEAALLFVNSLRNNFQAVRALKAVRVAIKTGKLPPVDDISIEDDDEPKPKKAGNATSNATSNATGAAPSGKPATDGKNTTKSDRVGLVELTSEHLSTIFGPLSQVMTEQQLSLLEETLTGKAPDVNKERGTQHVDNTKDSVELKGMKTKYDQKGTEVERQLAIIKKMLKNLRKTVKKLQGDEVEAAETAAQFQIALRAERRTLKENNEKLQENIGRLTPKLKVAQDKLDDCRAAEKKIQGLIQDTNSTLNTEKVKYEDKLKAQEDAVVGIKDLIKIYFENVYSKHDSYKKQVQNKIPASG